MEKMSGRGIMHYKEGLKTGHEMPHKPSTKQAKGYKGGNKNSGKSKTGGSKK